MMKEKETEVFGIPIEGASLEAVTQFVERATKPVWIVTANPEILLCARKDKTYAQALRCADLRVVDGFGLWLMLRLFGHHTHRVTGVELSEALVKMSAEKKWRVGLIGSVIPAQAGIQPGGLSSRWESGGVVASDGTDDDTGEESRHRMTLFDPHVLLVAFGHPKQERWIQKYAGDFPSLRVIVGVGGTFDFWSGRVKRAPVLLQHAGLEWLWRLFSEPRRIVRIFRAVVMFPIFFFCDALTKEK